MTRRTHLFSLASLLAVALTLGSSAVQAQTPSIVMASTTSTEQSGLFGFLLQELEDEYGYYSRTNQNEQLLDFWMNRKCK